MTQKTAAQIVADAGTYLADNDAREISAEDVRQRIIDLADSFANLLDLNITGSLGTAAYKNTGTSGNTVPLLDGANTFSAAQTIDLATSTATSLTVDLGSAATPAIAFVGGASTGIYARTTAILAFSVNNGERLRIATGDVAVQSTMSYSWSASSDPSGGSDLFLLRDAANTGAQRNGANPQFWNHHAKYGGTTDYHRVQTGTAVATLSGVSGATVTASALIPKGAILTGLTTKVTTALGTGGGTTGYTVGDGSDADRWGDKTATAAGTTTDNRDWTAGGERFFAAAQDVVITAKGGNFNGTGVIDVAVMYEMGQAD